MKSKKQEFTVWYVNGLWEKLHATNSRDLGVRLDRRAVVPFVIRVQQRRGCVNRNIKLEVA